LENHRSGTPRTRSRRITTSSRAINPHCTQKTHRNIRVSRLSPFESAPNPDYDQEDQEDKYYEPQTEQTTDILAAQFQHVLDLEDREPENPLTPQEPAYLHLIQEVVEAGFDVPPPPPLAEPEPELQAVVLPEQAEVQIVPAQPIVFAQQQALVQVAPVQPIVQPIMAQQPAQQAPAQQAPVAAQAAPQAAQIVAPVATTDKLRGTPPDAFNVKASTGLDSTTCTKSELVASTLKR